MAMATERPRVLVIDDEAVLRRLLQDMLAACGYEADVAEDGAAGIARFREGRYATVITDLLMPGMNGLEVVTALRTLDPLLNIILLTGSAPSLTASRAREMGVTLLHKPIALHDLKAAVDAACQA
jgi:two-component system, NarL family, capsular synthesis sensor histidine kinase RcsC